MSMENFILFWVLALPIVILGGVIVFLWVSFATRSHSRGSRSADSGDGGHAWSDAGPHHDHGALPHHDVGGADPGAGGFNAGGMDAGGGGFDAGGGFGGGFDGGACGGGAGGGGD